MIFKSASSAVISGKNSAVVIRAAREADLPRLNEIYNYYIINTPITFDLEPYTVEQRTPWFQQFASSGRYRLLVAQNEDNGIVVGYAGTTCWRPKRAYDTTVETTIYCAPETVGKGIGRRLYEALFEAIRGEDIHQIVAGYTLPNAASAALHERCGFRPVGVFKEVGRKFGKYWDVAWMQKQLSAISIQL